MPGETPTLQECATKLQYLFVLLFLSLSLVASQNVDQGNQSKPSPFLYPKLELNMAPILVQQVCAQLAEDRGLDIENSESASFVKHIEASIAQLKKKTAIPQTTIASMEAYAQAVAKLESEGRLQTVFAGNHWVNYAERKHFSEQSIDCSITALETTEQSPAEITGLSFHEGMHAVMFALETETKKVRPGYETQEPLTEFYGNLATYGARLAGETDKTLSDRLKKDGIDTPAVAVFLAEHGYRYDHPLFQYVESRKSVKWYSEILKTWENILKTYQDYYSPGVKSAQEEVDKFRQMLSDLQQPWLGYAWSDQDLRVMQSLEQKGLAEVDFFKP